MKNPFRKQGIIDTLVNVGIGGAANVAMDYAVAKIDALSSLDQTTINAVKIAVGALGGSMTKNKYLRAAVDGIATVGVSNLVAGYINQSEPASGLPEGTIGRLHMGQRGFRRARRVSGVQGASFMEC